MCFLNGAICIRELRNIVERGANADLPHFRFSPNVFKTISLMTLKLSKCASTCIRKLRSMPAKEI